MGMNTGKAGSAAQINVTPMIDILLVLLIIFMVIGPARSVGLEAQVPDEDGRPSTVVQEASVVLRMERDRTVYLNQELIAREQLGERLRGLYAGHPTAPLFLDGAPDLDFADIAWMIDTARGAGILHVGLMPGKSRERAQAVR